MIRRLLFIYFIFLKKEINFISIPSFILKMSRQDGDAQVDNLDS